MSETLVHNRNIPCIISVRPEVERAVPYIPGESLQTFSRRTGVPINKILKLNSNESPYDPVPAALHALRTYEWYNQYPDTYAQQLKEALSNYTGLDASYIVLGHGSTEVIHVLWHLFLSLGDMIICCPPTFSLYTSVTSLCGAQMRNVRRKPDYEIDLDAVIAALTPETKIIFLCSPNNPTGNLIAEDVLVALLETGRIIVVDEAYVEFSHRPAGYAHLVPDYPNLIVVRTLSKWAGLAGLRVGYGLFPQWIVTHMQRVQFPFEVNVAGHLAAIETFNHLDDALEKVHCIIEERERLFQMLSRQPYLEPIPSQGNFILARLSDKRISMEQVKQTMESCGILLRYFPQLEGHDFVRFTVGLSEHTERLADALEQVGQRKELERARSL